MKILLILLTLASFVFAQGWAVQFDDANEAYAYYNGTSESWDLEGNGTDDILIFISYKVEGLNATTTGCNFLSKRQTDDEEWWLAYNAQSAADALEFSLEYEGVNYVSYLRQNQGVNDGQWHTVLYLLVDPAMTADSDTAMVWTDGDSIGSFQEVTQLTGDMDNTGQFQLARRELAGDTLWFDFTIQKLAIWRGSDYTTASIDAMSDILHNNGDGGFDFRNDFGDYNISADLLSYYEFQEGSGTTVYDLKGNEDLTLSNATWTNTGTPAFTRGGESPGAPSNIQLLSESFSNFWRTNYDGLYGLYINDQTYHTDLGDSIHYDQSSRENHATVTGYANYQEMVDSTTFLGQKSPLYEGGGALGMNFDNAGGGATYGRYQITDADGNDFEFLATESFTFVTWFAFSDNTPISLANIVYAKYQNSSSSQWRYDWLSDNNAQGRMIIRDASANVVVSKDKGNLDDGVWHCSVTVLDRSTERLYMYLDNDSSTAGVGEAVYSNTVGAIANTGIVYVMFPGAGATDPTRIHAGRYFFKNRVLNDEEVAELTFLAKGWDSKNGNVYRNYAVAYNQDADFFQGFYGDTISYPLPTATGKFTLLVDGKAGTKGDTLHTYLGSSATAKQVVNRGFNSSYVNFDLNTIEGDSLYFYANSGDTLYIDNVILKQGIRRGRLSRQQWSKLIE